MSDTALDPTTNPYSQPNPDPVVPTPTATVTPDQTGSPIGSMNKESGPMPSSAESTPLIELKEQEKIPEEVESWLQKLDQAGEITLPEPITHDGDVLLASTEAQVVKEKIVLPMTQTGMQQGLKATVTNSARWLAEWCARLIKVVQGEVKYAPEENKHL